MDLRRDMYSTDRFTRQIFVRQWVVNTFGVNAMGIEERILRFFEEATELAQACGLTKAAALRILNHVYSRPVGETPQEVGGVGVTLLALCAALDLGADELEELEVSRIKDPKLTAKIQRKQLMKIRAGISAFRECLDCAGRGWHVGECHPQEVCGACDGKGYKA
jgi:hypothetical protein